MEVLLDANTLAIIGTTLSVLAVGWLYRDYRAWIDFGTGGTPSNFQGYLKVTKFRILRAFSGDSLKDHSTLSPDGPSYLTEPLPTRQGSPPPIIPRTLPQRHQPARIPLDDGARRHLHALVEEYGTSHPEHLDVEPSITEGRTTNAIYAKKDRQHGARDSVLGHEIAHVHPQDDSLHVWLTHADAKKVIAAGWGERFPLASLGMIDSGWTFVYAPRNMGEVLVVERVVKAGIGHLTGKSV